ncbi:retrovirus-related Pol polyprotein from transposon opus [Trichonephila clavipes]|nr:retrovirus-related Pol polyprotein from transposon opus [Trichonephila clavipes]
MGAHGVSNGNPTGNGDQPTPPAGIETQRGGIKTGEKGQESYKRAFGTFLGEARNVGASRFNEPDGRQGCVLARTVESNQGGRFDSNESVADSFPSGAVGFKSWSATILGAFSLLRLPEKPPGSSESVQEFAARINKLGTQIFQSSNTVQNTEARNANDQLLQSRFISGLRNDIRRFVLARDPNNLEESINAALIEEQNVKLNQIANDERTGFSPLQTETSVISALTNKLEKINLRCERLQEASSVTARKTSGGLFRRRETLFKCYYCGLEGHKQSECRKFGQQNKNRLFQLLISHKSAFACSTIELSAAATEHHRISLQHDYPIKCPVYKIPFNLRNEFRRQIADLEKAGIISKSNSQYNTPALFVKQKEKWCLVLDFRKLNEITLTQDFVIPTLEAILHEISGSNYFSALDMKSAFNQIPLHFSDRLKTVFFTPDGDKYEFNRLCFGLKNSPNAFQSIAEEVLGDLLHNGALVYIDDIILFTKTVDEHFELLALPLTNLLRKDTPFEWTSKTQEAFDDIKKAILNPPVLALPDPNAELQITTDASSRGIGAVLEQKYPNSEVKPLYFFQRN